MATSPHSSTGTASSPPNSRVSWRRVCTSGREIDLAMCVSTQLSPAIASYLLQKHERLIATTARSLGSRRRCGPALLAVGSLLAPAPGLAQTLPLDPSAYKNLRYEESYVRLADPAKRIGWFDRIKFIPLGQDPRFYLTLGGEVRERFESFNYQGFGLLPVRNDSYFLQRVLVHADLHLGPHVRTFVQLGDHRAFGKQKPLQPIDVGRFDLQQGFIEFNVPLGSLATITGRAGRQEILVGSGRFIGIADGPNVRRTHDGVRASATFQGGAKLDAWVVRPKLPRIGSFDDRGDPDQLFAALYTSVPVLPPEPAPPGEAGSPLGPRPVLGVDGYFVELATGRPSLTYGAGFRGTEHRRTVAVRVHGAVRGFDYDLEGLFQFGNLGPATVSAGGASIDAGYTLHQLPWQPRLGIKANAFTGDSDPNDRRIGTFNPLFPRAVYFSEPGLQTFSNLVDFSPRLTVNPTRSVAVEFGLDFTWRASTRDAVYLAPLVPVPGTADARGRYIGTNFIAQAIWGAAPNLTVNGALVHIAAGPAITNARGKDITYAATWLQLKF